MKKLIVIAALAFTASAQAAEPTWFPVAPSIAMDVSNVFAKGTVRVVDVKFYGPRGQMETKYVFGCSDGTYKEISQKATFPDGRTEEAQGRLKIEKIKRGSLIGDIKDVACSKEMEAEVIWME